MVGSDALPSSSPSLIWLQLGFGFARAVTIATVIHIRRIKSLVDS